MSMGSHVAKYCPWGVGALEHGRSYLLKTNRNTITIVFSLNYEITCSSHRLGEKKTPGNTTTKTGEMAQPLLINIGPHLHPMFINTAEEKSTLKVRVRRVLISVPFSNIS